MTSMAFIVVVTPVSQDREAAAAPGGNVGDTAPVIGLAIFDSVHPGARIGPWQRAVVFLS